ncbi:MULTISPECIES: PTS sugar transporter subunit IIA [Thermomonospora]|uniref:PTS system, glucose subfamily, IIA subunit n=1 Tax=Thermomonospora curvata (strain ATCC 19995 / DSM 43183 / JCM 3096 / KCTC 9072 / NBRC 15933 / NCIMB 10081 / Henssen B9) TaxID=471852 RepID=D1AF13_THECD|nr:MULTISPECIES: PTS glucose transporter subunit IIA [Thermomonospora]ACY99557.1 PTS system, glucose subfamily, IIA subunit [Thermomonospora curvata DSM 43183]PKK12594.1 MAG: phosphoenolpyruvate--carbohydrate phosphotransferase [Thermomonospora sp. CIF 1]
MTRVLAPVSGRVVGLAGVPDPVFAQAMVGPGTAVDPERGPGEAIAPVSGKIVKMHPHAYVVVDAEGHGVLVHLGVDTVQLKGRGFEMLAAEGDEVVAGQPLIRWNPAEIEAGGRSPVTAVVALDAGAEALSDVRESGRVEKGAGLFSWH